MADNLVMSTYLDETLDSNINFLRGEEDNINSLNKSLEISMLNIDDDKMGTLGSIKESSEAVQISNDDVKKETVVPHTEVAVEKKKEELEHFVIVEDLPINDKVVTQMNEEVETKQERAVNHEVLSCDGSIIDKGSHESKAIDVELCRGNVIDVGLCEGNVIDVNHNRNQRNESKTVVSLHNTKNTIKMTKDKPEEVSPVKSCILWRKKISSSSDHHQHVNIHKAKKLFQCRHCNKSFRQSNHLKMHEQIHSGQQRSFQCGMCFETFRYKSAQNSHMKKHFGVKDHSCEVCSASFHSKYELKIHMVKHTGELPYTCKECGDKFAVASRLKRHMTIHTGERPFQCEVCGVVFREQFILNTHMGIHLPRGPYPCDICGEVFSRLNSLTLHRRVHNTDNTYSYVPKICNQKKNTALVASESPAHNTLVDGSRLDESIFENNLPTSDEINSGNKICEFSNLETNSNTHQDLHSYIPVWGDADPAKIDLEKGLLEEGVTSAPHPRVVREALSTGTLVESQADDGKGYLIVLPKALVERNYTLFTVSPPAITHKIPETVDQIMLKENNEVLHNNCNLFVYGNDLDSVPEAGFQPNQETDSEEAQNKAKKPKKRRWLLSDDEEDAIESEIQHKKTEKQPIKKKVKKKKKPLVSRLYRCQQCGKDYKTSCSLNIHMRTHTGERPYSCDYCGLGFKQLSHLQSHVRIHTGENPYKCKQCEQAFNQSSRLKYHVRTVHVMGKIKKAKVNKQCCVRNFYCKICDYTFLNSCFKTDHMKTHADETQYKCEKCDASFKGKSSLKKHQSCHADDKWGICEVCGLQYKDHDTLNLHKKELHGITDETISIQSDVKFGMVDDDKQSNSEILKHSDDVQLPSLSQDDVEQTTITNSSSGKNLEEVKETIYKMKVLEDGKYQCCMCDKIFNTRSNTLVHMRLHSDLKPYKCSDCRRAFRQISHLKDHVRIHTGEKPFKCSVCPATFAQSSGVKVHIKKYHKGKAFVINEQRKKHNMKEDSIVFENVPQTCDDRLIISIENGQSVSVDHKQNMNEQETNVDIEEHCNVCDKTFLTRYMKFHMLAHKKTFYKCVVCKKNYKIHELSSHQNKKNTVKNYVCSKCENTEHFPSDGLSRISDVDIEDQCNICDKTFLMRHMKLHMRTHKKRFYKCVVCKKNYKMHELSSHQSKKNTVKNYVCTKCEGPEHFPCDGLSRISDGNPTHSLSRISDGNPIQRSKRKKN